MPFYTVIVLMCIFSLSFCDYRNARSFGLVGGYQHGSAFVFHEENDEFRRFGLACVPPNDVDIIGALVKELTR